LLEWRDHRRRGVGKVDFMAACERGWWRHRGRGQPRRPRPGQYSGASRRHARLARRRAG